MKIVVAPDKFKGSLTSFEACKSIAAGINGVSDNADVQTFPMADGGDGFAAVLQHYLKTQTITCPTVDPVGRSIEGTYQWDEPNQTAIIELAIASGLVLLKEEEQNPLVTSTFGTGLLIKDAIKKGAKKIVLGLGGSATNDAGTGILKALGYSFLNSKKIELEPCGGKLSMIKEIIAPNALPQITFDIACDVQNPLYGENGAAFIYAPQKGADSDEVLLLDEGLKHFHQLLFQQTQKNIADIPGTGAAGGIAAGLMAYFDVTLKKGTEMVIAASGIGNAIQSADIVITGEGKIDAQSKEGKVVERIAALAKQYDVPAIGLCGILHLDAPGIKQLGLSYASAICNEPSSPEACINNAAKLLREKTSAIALFCIEMYKKEK